MSHSVIHVKLFKTPWTVCCQAPLSMKTKSLLSKKKKKVPFRSSSKERLFIVLSAAVDSPPRPSCSKSASFLVSNRTDHSSPQNRKITIKLQKANACPTLPSYCSCHLKFLLFFSLKSGVLSSCFLFLGSSVHNLRPFSPPIIYPSTSFLL